MGVLSSLQFQAMGTLTVPFSPSNPSAVSIRKIWFSNSMTNFRRAAISTSLEGRRQARRAKIASPKAAATDEGEEAEIVGTQDADFEERLARLQRKVRSGSGKKAELRKLRKAGMDTSKIKSRKTGILLPPIPLKDPMSGGLKVELGFNSYTERLNGIFAALGLAALLLVELGSGKSLIKYHAPGTLILQTYFVLAMAALVVKYEREKISIWPKNKS